MTDQYVAPTEGMPEGFVLESKEQNVVDTAQLQFQELIRFASVLGFEFTGKNFERQTKNKVLKTVTTLSFNRMVNLYQTEVESSVPCLAVCGKYGFIAFNRFAFDTYNLIPFYLSDLKAALDSRELERIKLQLKGDGSINALSNKVKFLNEDYGKEFAELVASADVE